MPTACILQSNCRIRLTSERLEVWGHNPASGVEEILREIPIRDVDRVILAESVQISSSAMAALLRAAVPVNYLGWNGQFLGGFLPAGNAHGQSRLLQYQRSLGPAFALSMAGRVVTAKLYNQRRVLQRLAASRKPETVGQTSGLPVEGASGSPGGQEAEQSSLRLRSKLEPSDRRSNPPETQAALAWLDALFAPISRASSADELRGYEGAATARYFQAWAEFLPPEFPFERRSTRPPLNAVNACISFGATLLYSEAVAFIHAHGLDPALGFLHAPDNGRWSLALDLIEPFRPALVESQALDLFSHDMLSERHFEPKNGGVYLNEEGRRKFILQYERRMERQFMSECAGHRTTLRQQLEQQAVMLKSALQEPGTFEPFLMN